MKLTEDKVKQLEDAYNKMIKSKVRIQETYKALREAEATDKHARELDAQAQKELEELVWGTWYLEATGRASFAEEIHLPGMENV